jgi:hypothetical protein
MSDLSDLPAAIRVSIEADELAPSQFLIHGVTFRGRAFRPSDWSERLCGVLAPYQPGASGDEAPPIDFSPYARPVVVNGHKCVRIDVRLRDIEPVALTFVLNFVRDNELVTTQVPGRGDCPAAAAPAAAPGPARASHGGGQASIAAVKARTARGAVRARYAIALIAADRRLLLRAARFLWTSFLSAIESITLVEARSCAVAAALSPAAIALRTFLIAVRRRVRSAVLCSLWARAWRERLRACLLLAIALLSWIVGLWAVRSTARTAQARADPDRGAAQANFGAALTAASRMPQLAHPWR